MKLAIALIAAASLTSSAMAVTYSDDFSSNTSANYATDRANPGGFTISGGTLNVNVLTSDAPGQTDPFYNFHGVQTGPLGDFNLAAPSSVSVDLFVPSSWNGATAKRGGDLWARINDVTDPNPGNDYYPSIGVYNYADGDGAKLSLFSPTVGGFDGNPLTDDSFLDLPSVSINYDAFNKLALRLTATGVEYVFNGQVVATDLEAGYVLPGTELEQAYLQGWQGESDYVATFDNLNVAVPEPTTLAAVAGASSLLLRRRRA